MEKNHKISFYEHCVREGIEYIDELEKTGKFEKAKLIAEQYSISFDDIKEAFSLGEQLYREIEINAIEQNKVQLKRDEESLRNYLTRYSEYVGRDKKLAMLRDELNILEQQLSGAYDSMESSSSSAGYQKEQSWAIHGGIASALGGAGAGVATAIDVQQRNQQIRNQNEALFALKNMTYGISKQQAEILQSKIDKINDEINNVKIKLVLEEEKNRLFECLKCTTESCEISETGNFKIKTIISQTDVIPIYENKNTIIDGTIIATMYQDGDLVGQAKLVLPISGAVYAEVEGISEGKADINKKFDIMYEPYRLWVIEA